MNDQDPDESVAQSGAVPPAESALNENERMSLYVEIWKQSVQVNMHFNDIEWRIRGLALTAATFALGAAGVAARDGAQVMGISLGTLVLGVGLLLWYAFYFVDRAWYHPLLKASVDHAEAIEGAMQASLPTAGLAKAITDGSGYQPNGLVRWLSRTETEMRSDDKLVWFYRVGALALVLVAVLLQIGTLVDSTDHDQPQQVEVHLDHRDDR